MSGGGLWPAEEYAVKRSLGQCWGYAAVSFGLWMYFWFFNNRKLLDGELGEGKDQATLHTLGLFVPILNFFVVYWLWRDLNVLRTRVGLPAFPAVPYVIGSIFLAPLFYSLVLGQFNEHWDVRTQGLAKQAPLVTAEKALIIAGAALFGLWFLFILLAIVLTVAASASPL